MYEKCFKRLLDFFLALVGLILLSPLLLVLTVVGAIVMKGNPFFMQKRPGLIDPKTGRERIISLLKLRSMTNERDAQGNLLPDEKRLVPYGKFLRSSSMDELPSLINILKGDVALCGPRPQLVRDMCFMTPRQRRRHTVRPGLTGLAQINGRNNITWEQKFEYDLQYIDSGITFLGDLKIVLQTVGKVLKRSDTVREGTVSDMDYGDWLMEQGKVSQAEYDEKQAEAIALLAAAK